MFYFYCYYCSFLGVPSSSARHFFIQLIRIYGIYLLEQNSRYWDNVPS